MVAAPSHHTFHRLSRLLTTFLAQMRPVSDPVENSGAVSLKQPGTNDRSITDATLPQGASESTIEQNALPDHNLEPVLSSVPVEHDDSRSKKTFISEQQWKDQRSNKPALKYSTESSLRCKKAYLIINPRAGHNFTRISDVLAILSAAGWKTDIAVKHYVGHVIELATRAAEQDYDLVIAYGGDGTINHVVNGVMAAKGKGRRKAIGVIPGGTANQWSSETSVPVDP
ncbi:MAG TPA: acylglycerol kinase family protein, partial [Ktedonobacteraceae bacterium]|nr:acylglycerol kinase family protein [Ktedonobacteraceae bacterium]